MVEQPCLREKQIQDNTGKSQSVTSLVQFAFDAKDVFRIKFNYV